MFKSKLFFYAVIIQYPAYDNKIVEINIKLQMLFFNNQYLFNTTHFSNLTVIVSKSYEHTSRILLITNELIKIQIKFRILRRHFSAVESKIIRVLECEFVSYNSYLMQF